MSRKYIKIDEYGKQIPEMKAQGKTSREIAQAPGADQECIQNWVFRFNRPAWGCFLSMSTNSGAVHCQICAKLTNSCTAFYLLNQKSDLFHAAPLHFSGSGPIGHPQSSCKAGHGTKSTSGFSHPDHC